MMPHTTSLKPNPNPQRTAWALQCHEQTTDPVAGWLPRARVGEGLCPVSGCGGSRAHRMHVLRLTFHHRVAKLFHSRTCLKVLFSFPFPRNSVHPLHAAFPLTRSITRRDTRRQLRDAVDSLLLRVLPLHSRGRAVMGPGFNTPKS